MNEQTTDKTTLRRRRTVFRFDRPAAKAVSVAGDFNGWDVEVHPMRREPSGVWIKIMFLRPGRYEYRFYADGRWCNDPGSSAKCANCYGTQNDYMVVPD
jgi:1,4-alpha-glucan branching enzyme